MQLFQGGAFHHGGGGNQRSGGKIERIRFSHACTNDSQAVVTGSKVAPVKTNNAEDPNNSSLVFTYAHHVPVH